MVTMLIHTRSYNNHGRWQHKGTRLEEESQSKADTLQKAEQACGLKSMVPKQEEPCQGDGDHCHSLVVAVLCMPEWTGEMLLQY